MKSCPWTREALYCCLSSGLSQWGSVLGCVRSHPKVSLPGNTVSLAAVFSAEWTLASWGVSPCSLHVDISPLIMTFSFWLLFYLSHPASLPKGCNSTCVACQGYEGTTTFVVLPTSPELFVRCPGSHVALQGSQCHCSGAGLQLPTALAMVPAEPAPVVAPGPGPSPQPCVPFLCCVWPKVSSVSSSWSPDHQLWADVLASPLDLPWRLVSQLALAAPRKRSFSPPVNIITSLFSLFTSFHLYTLHCHRSNLWPNTGIQAKWNSSSLTLCI